MRKTFVTSIAVAVALTFGFATGAWAQNPFDLSDGKPDSGIDGKSDPHGNQKELGPLNSNGTKISPINRASPPMLDFTNPNGQVDLGTVYIATKQAQDKDLWLYFAWVRPDSNTGSGYISVEFQQSALPSGCVYEGVDFTNKNDQETAALIKSCNPWSGRKDGDFIITWDQQGNGLAFDDIKKRTFTCTGSGPQTCTLGGIEDLETVEAAVATDRFSGEMAINFTEEIFNTAQSCITFLNILPNTVTGNSDSADYKDTILATFPPITNCGILKVTKVLQDPSGNPLSDPAAEFGYAIARQSGADLRFEADAPDHPLDGAHPQKQIVRPNAATDAPAIHGGETHTHGDLIPGTDYTLDEHLVDGRYTKISIICDDGTKDGQGNPLPRNVYPNGDTYAIVIPNGVKETSCVITNRLKQATPDVATLPASTVLLRDFISVTGIQTGGSGQMSVTFRLYNSKAACEADTARDKTVGQAGSGLLFAVTKSVSDAAQVQAETHAAGSGVSAPANGTYYWWTKFNGNNFNKTVVKGVPADDDDINADTRGCGPETTDVQITHFPVGQ
jgi:hypothetical protein